MSNHNNIIFFVVGLNSGGIENYLLRYIRENSHKFNKIIIFCKGNVGGVLEDDYKIIDNVTIVKRHIGNYHIHHYIYLIKWLKRYKDYGVCDFTGNFSGPILLAARFVGIKPRIAFYRSSTNRFKENTIKLFVNKLFNLLVLKNSTNILANSEHAFRFFFNNEKDDPRMKLIYNGISVNFQNEKGNIFNEIICDSKAIKIGHVGRLNSAKNHETIIEVAERIIKKGYNVHFILCGKDVRKELFDIVKKKNIESYFSLFNNRSDISKVLNSIDIFYFPSLTEGQPNALLEAWVKGIPFIASNIPPIEMITPESYKKFLVNPLKIEEHTQIIEEMINNPWNQNLKIELSNYAKDVFDSKRRFDEFTNLLIDN